MTHTEKLKIAKQMAKRGASGVFNSKAWWNRKETIAMKEASRCKNFTMLITQ